MRELAPSRKVGAGCSLLVSVHTPTPNSYHLHATSLPAALLTVCAHRVLTALRNVRKLCTHIADVLHTQPHTHIHIPQMPMHKSKETKGGKKINPKTGKSG